MQRKTIIAENAIPSIQLTLNEDNVYGNENLELEAETKSLELEKVMNRLERNVGDYTKTNIYQAFKILIDGKWLPEHIDTPEVAMSIQKFGAEVGLQMMQAFHQITPIEGKLTLSARAISAIMRAKGVKFIVTKYAEYMYNVNGVIKISPFPLYSMMSAEHENFFMGRITEITARRRFLGDTEDTVQVVTYTTKDAENQGLLHKDNWKRLLGEMLLARCISRLNTVFATDLTLGISSTEEVVDMHKHLSLTYNDDKVKVIQI